MSDRGKCPSCGEPVGSWRPIIEQGVDADRVAGWSLSPCGHVCRRVDWTRARGHRFHDGL